MSTTTKTSRAAAFAPRSEVISLPSGLEVEVLASAPSMLAFVNEGVVDRAAVFGQPIEQLNAVMDAAPRLINEILLDPKIHQGDADERPEDEILFRWLTDEDVDALLSRVIESDEEVAERARTFRDDDGGAADREGGEVLGDDPEPSAA
ncbi:hypothetical protein [Paraconexibacter algicola]|uniref:Uncharacterized protein n=1 Tax=Paraconexibacter algicola TaxID=2133960 RepID=A0A2T4UE60_9ACTN|nr:hypothetical protein [Paraconexibacter algicola]PTL55755.1 hypothetical protein C7Y72_19190 [Paraconexibacter algicola]